MTLRQFLLQFLREARQVHLQFLSGAFTEPPVYVLGNPSADLDSIISAIVYSYCASNRLPSTTPRPHVPIINLPIPSGPELCRLRPEFVTALWLSTSFPALEPDARFENSSESTGKLLGEHVVTVADFAQGLREHKSAQQLVADVTMVDWNAMPHRVDGKKGYGSVDGLSEVTFRTVGCIDHHVDEHFVPTHDALPANQPLVIQPGPGSCSSLVTNEIVRRGLWAPGASSAESAQLAKLALAAILIDTSNLTAEGKVTEVDIEAVKFLREQVAKYAPKWNAEAFYEKIHNAKANSLDLLSLNEVLDRDYKEWSETTSSGESVKLGFCSSVKPIRWIVQKAGTSQQFLDAVRAFAASKKLDMVVVMTSFSSAEDEFSRELFVCARGDCDAAVKAAKTFVEQAGSQLGLGRWSPVDCERSYPTTDEIQSTLEGDLALWRRLWLQMNTTASRKQVAPLLRKAVASL